eukprot:8786422-Lingulodinium_polyedra.AAC.1
MSRVIVEYLASGKAYESSGGPFGAAYAADHPVPMDVGGISQDSKGKGKGEDKNTCLNCGKQGRWARDCWQAGGGAAKGGDKGEGKGKGDEPKCA